MQAVRVVRAVRVMTVAQVCRYVCRYGPNPAQSQYQPCSTHLGDALDEDVDQLHLRFAQPVSVRNVPRAARRSGVDAGGAARLEAHVLHDVLLVDEVSG